MRTIFLFLALSIVLLAISCEETSSPSKSAVRMTKSEIIGSVGFSWFNYEWSKYNPNDSVVGDIESLYDSSVHKFYIFMIPSCSSCDSIIASPVELIKTLDMAGVAESNYIIYSMTSTSAKHPFEDLLEINRLPAAFLFRDSVPVYSILDTLKFWRERGRNLYVEEVVSEALRAN